jgi:hypothetical protein
MAIGASDQRCKLKIKHVCIKADKHYKKTYFLEIEIKENLVSY